MILEPGSLIKHKSLTPLRCCFHNAISSDKMAGVNQRTALSRCRNGLAGSRNGPFDAWPSNEDMDCADALGCTLGAER